MLNINFVIVEDGVHKVKSTEAKKMRGIMLNWIIENEIETTERLKMFAIENYIFSPSHSDNENYTFIKNNQIKK